MSGLNDHGKNTRAKITFKHVEKKHKGKFLLIALGCLLVVFLSSWITVVIMRNHITDVKLFFNQGSSSKKSSSMDEVTGIVDKAMPSMASVVAVNEKDGVVSEEDVSSGIAVEDGTYILTSYSSVSGADKIKVKSYDNTVYDASIAGFNSAYDIAMLKLVSGIMEPVEISGTSIQVDGGETIISVGNPEGKQFGSGFQIGKVRSSFNNFVFKSNGTKLVQNLRVIRTDIVPKSINNCSALYDMSGKFLGISSIALNYGNDNGMYSSYITCGDLKPIITSMYKCQESLIKYVGIYGESAVSQKQDGIEGVYAKDVTLDSPGYKIGIRPTDIITAVNGIKVDEVSDVNHILENIASGDVVSFTVFKNYGYTDYELQLNKNDE